MNAYDFQYSEELLRRLLSLLLGVFADSEKDEVQDFMGAGEYGLALETLVDIVLEENKHIPGASLVLICELADVMRLDKKVFEEKLCGHLSIG